MNIDNIIFPQTAQSYFSDENGILNQQQKQQFKNQKIPEGYNIDDDQTIKASGRIFYLKSDYNNQITHMPVQFEKSAQVSQYQVLYFHMNSDDLGDVFKHLENLTSFHNGLNFNVLAMEQPNQGTQRAYQCDEESVAYNSTILYDFVKKYFNVTDEYIILQGRSIGTSVALKLASLRNPLAVVLISPLQSINNLVKKWIGWWSFIIKDSFNVDHQQDKIKSKILIVHGEQDRVVSIENAYQLKDKLDQQVTLKIIRKGNHQNITNQQIYNFVKDWLHSEGLQIKDGTPFVTSYYVEFPSEYYREVKMPEESGQKRQCTCFEKKIPKQVILNNGTKEVDKNQSQNPNETNDNDKNKNNQVMLSDNHSMKQKMDNQNLNSVMNKRNLET